MSTTLGPPDLPPSLREQVERRIGEFLGESDPKRADLRRAVARAHVLPLCFDWSTCLAISPGGQIVWLWYEEPYEVEAVHEERVWNLALFQGIGRYPELLPLLPSRPSDARDCPDCQGTGRPPIPASLEHHAGTFVCSCGGIGWLPASDRESARWWRRGIFWGGRGERM